MNPKNIMYYHVVLCGIFMLTAPPLHLRATSVFNVHRKSPDVLEKKSGFESYYYCINVLGATNAINYMGKKIQQ